MRRFAGRSCNGDQGAVDRDLLVLVRKAGIQDLERLALEQDMHGGSDGARHVDYCFLSGRSVFLMASWRVISMCRVQVRDVIRMLPESYQHYPALT